MKPETALILVPHGSRNPEWNTPFQQLTRQLAHEGRAVYLAFMQCTPPTLMDAAREIMAGPVRHCRLLPLFMAKGTHFFDDIPRQIAEVKTTFPELEIELLPPIGLHPLFTGLVRQIADEG